MADIIRVLRVIEYVGERSAIEEVVSKSIHGVKQYDHRLENGSKASVTIRAGTVGLYPELLTGDQF